MSDDERRRQLLNSFDEFQAKLERLVADAPVTSEEINRFGTELSALYGPGKPGPITPPLGTPESKPKPKAGQVERSGL